MTWELFAGSDQQWDQTINGLAYPSPYQMSAWSNFRNQDGWNSVRLIANNHSAAIQILIRRVFGVVIAWAPGGPLGEITADSLNGLRLQLQLHLSANISYIRLADFSAGDDGRVEQYLRAGWRRPRTTLSSGRTLTRSLTADTESLRASYTKNWSRNLRRGEERGVTASVWTTPDISTLVELHQSVAETKGIPSRDWRTNAARFQHLLSCFHDQIVIVRATDSSGATHAIRGAVLCGTQAFDFLAATSHEGRRLYASNVALHGLLKVLVQRGLATYDFGGIDQVKNKGVYDFKHGAGGHDHAYSGEFEATDPRILSSALSTLVSLRLAN
jgi:lipid II:glycine glycyltransferase (peptidoglycan interpeptide bridge formation enzyme)